MATNKKIVFIDDEEINVLLFKINFSTDYDVLTGSSGFEGLELLNTHPDIDVVLSDMKMPEMDGIEFIKTAKKKFPDKKYFIVTGFEITVEIQHGIESGLIDKYLRKPFNIKDIKRALDEQ